MSRFKLTKCSNQLAPNGKCIRYIAAQVGVLITLARQTSIVYAIVSRGLTVRLISSSVYRYSLTNSAQKKSKDLPVSKQETLKRLIDQPQCEPRLGAQMPRLGLPAAAPARPIGLESEMTPPPEVFSRNSGSILPWHSVQWRSLRVLKADSKALCLQILQV